MIKIHPLLRGADSSYLVYIFNYIDSSPLASGQTPAALTAPAVLVIHPLLRGADAFRHPVFLYVNDLSPPTRGRLILSQSPSASYRFIPSYEGQTDAFTLPVVVIMIHPLLRGADSAA